MSKNIAFLWEPHNITKCARVAVSKQQGKDWNYIIICCSPERNGVYKYSANNTANYSIWTNKTMPCYEVPMTDLQFVQTLESITTASIINEIKKQQKAWCKKYRAKTQPWMLS